MQLAPLIAAVRLALARAADTRRGVELIRRHGSYRAALFACHPDHGGTPEDLACVVQARHRGRA
jgi:hypothetical protein